MASTSRNGIANVVRVTLRPGKLPDDFNFPDVIQHSVDIRNTWEELLRRDFGCVLPINSRIESVNKSTNCLKTALPDQPIKDFIGKFKKRMIVYQAEVTLFPDTAAIQQKRKAPSRKRSSGKRTRMSAKVRSAPPPAPTFDFHAEHLFEEPNPQRSFLRPSPTFSGILNRPIFEDSTCDSAMEKEVDDMPAILENFRKWTNKNSVNAIRNELEKLEEDKEKYWQRIRHIKHTIIWLSQIFGQTKER